MRDRGWVLAPVTEAGEGGIDGDSLNDAANERSEGYVASFESYLTPIRRTAWPHLRHPVVALPLAREGWPPGSVAHDGVTRRVTVGI